MTNPYTIRKRIYDSITQTIGATPLVRLHNVEKEKNIKAKLLAKCEFFNPIASVKDRIGVAMIEDLEQQGKLTQDSVLIEPTSGNTGIALAFACAAKNYKLILTMPETMSLERRKMLALFGAQLELTEGAKGMKGAIARADELLAEIPNAISPRQFSNPANPQIHQDSTAQEIWEDTKGEVDAIVSGIGTGGTFTGTGRFLKAKNPNIKMIAVEPEDSAVISGNPPGPHKIQGIGAGFIPDNMDTKLLDEVLCVGNETACQAARFLAKCEGIPGGISSGAALSCGIEVGQRDSMKDKTIIIIIPSFAERYLSTALFEGL